MWSVSPACVLWLLLLGHVLVCLQLLSPACSQQSAQGGVVPGPTGCYATAPANPPGTKIDDSNDVIVSNQRIVGILSWYSPTMQVMCNFTMLYSSITGGTGWLKGPAHGFADDSCTQGSMYQNTDTFKRDWFYTGGYFTRGNFNGATVFTGLYMQSRCGLEYCGGSGGCRNGIALVPNSTFTPFTPGGVTNGSGWTYQTAYNDTMQIRSPNYPFTPDRYMTCITSLGACYNITTVPDCSKPGGGEEAEMD